MANRAYADYDVAFAPRTAPTPAVSNKATSFEVAKVGIFEQLTKVFTHMDKKKMLTKEHWLNVKTKTVGPTEVMHV